MAKRLPLLLFLLIFGCTADRGYGSTPAPQRAAPPQAAMLPMAHDAAARTPNLAARPVGSPVPDPRAMALVEPTPDPGIAICADAVHNEYASVGPDGKLYATWHPQQDPSGCYFAHEHGDDPGSVVIPGSPPILFGYTAVLADMPGELAAHTGNKVSVSKSGDINKNGYKVLGDMRLVFHMGTSGPSRFDVRFHGLRVDWRGDDGSYMHVQTMGDTGRSMTICERDAGDANAPSKVVMFVPGIDPACDARTPSSYEIWHYRGKIRDATKTRLSFDLSAAVFDPISILDSRDPPAERRLLYFADFYQGGTWPRDPHGANRETYGGPFTIDNQTSNDGLRFRDTFLTDVMGNPVPDGTPGALAQVVSPCNYSAAISPLAVKRPPCGPLAIASGGPAAHPNPAQYISEDNYSRLPGLGPKN